jgi:hypothetical protein
VSRDFDRPAQEFDPLLPARWIGRHERRFMLYAPIEQKPAARFDDAAKVVLSQRRLDLLELPLKSIIQRIERPMIERDRDALVANLGQNLNGVEQVVMGEAIGVVGEEHYG